jgi:hypothetical protein
MTKIGARHKRTLQAELEFALVSQFCERICGSWWGRQWSQNQDEVRLALFRISAEGGFNTVRVDGDTFDSQGRLFGTWKSVATGIQVSESKLFYSWEGTHPAIAPGEAFQGFGQYTFKGASGIYEHGDGLFADIHKGRKKTALWKSVEFRRVDSADSNRVTQLIKNGTDAARAAEVASVLRSFIGMDGQRP